MKNIQIVSLAFMALLAGSRTTAQMNVGSSSAPHADAALQITSTNKGLLLPTLALTATNSAIPLSAFVAGMTVYNTAVSGTSPHNVTPGLYYCDGTQWLKLSTSNGSVVLNSSSTIDAAILGYNPSTSATAASNAPATVAIGSVTATRRGTYTYGANKHTYAAFTTSGAITWYQAYEAAKTMGGYLATFTTDAEWQAVETNLLTDANGFNTNGAWIGFCKFSYSAGSALNPDPEMKWITGEQAATDYASGGTSAVRKMNWFANGEPNNSSATEGFVHIYGKNNNTTKLVNGYTSTHAWNDIPANNTVQLNSWGFIVEFQQ
ncbi:MAG: C-type lectin domain-containing protein [Bacteroidota bacterium]|nr:C-type lectin domain-containing protein [Bacteroidota bacterium]